MTEKGGRVHSSTVTVSVLPDAGDRLPCPDLRDEDLEIEWYSGSGAGGQHRNRHPNSARVRHLPTGIVVTAQCRKRPESLRRAKEALEERLSEMARLEVMGAENEIRADQVGTGMRADKRRTWRFQDDQVKDHLTGRSARCSKVLKGRFDLLWK